MTEKTRVRLSFGRGQIPINQIDGVREALAALFGKCPPFEASDERGEWLVELPTEYAEFRFLTLNAGIFNLVTRL